MRTWPFQGLCPLLEVFAININICRKQVLSPGLCCSLWSWRPFKDLHCSAATPRHTDAMRTQPAAEQRSHSKSSGSKSNNSGSSSKPKIVIIVVVGVAGVVGLLFFCSPLEGFQEPYEDLTKSLRALRGH